MRKFGHKNIGRPLRPPMEKSEFLLKVVSWYLFTTPLEPILNRIQIMIEAFKLVSASPLGHQSQTIF